MPVTQGSTVLNDTWCFFCLFEGPRWSVPGNDHHFQQQGSARLLSPKKMDTDKELKKNMGKNTTETFRNQLGIFKMPRCETRFATDLHLICICFTKFVRISLPQNWPHFFHRVKTNKKHAEKEKQNLETQRNIQKLPNHQAIPSSHSPPVSFCLLLL